MIKTLFETEDIVKEFETFAYLHGYDLSCIDIVVPMIREEKIVLYRKDDQTGGKRKYYNIIQWEEEGEMLSMIWLSPVDEFLSTMAREWSKKIPL